MISSTREAQLSLNRHGILRNKRWQVVHKVELHKDLLRTFKLWLTLVNNPLVHYDHLVRRDPLKTCIFIPF